MENMEEIQKHLTINNYVFLHEMDMEVEGIHVISLINKQAFLAKVQEHIDLFKSILGDHVTPECLLEKISAPHASLFKILKCHEGLYGILLGFGKNNSFAFKRRLELAKLVDPLYRDFPVCFSLFFPQHSNEFSSFEDEYSSLQKQLHPFSCENDLSHVVFPYMVAFENDEETIRLKQKYHEERQKIVKIYSKGDFLETTLKHLCK